MQDAQDVNADALHPSVSGLDISLIQRKQIGDMPVRAWGGDEPFFGENRVLKEKNMRKYAAFGVTDVITNVPELYL